MSVKRLTSCGQQLEIQHNNTTQLTVIRLLRCGGESWWSKLGCWALKKLGYDRELILSPDSLEAVYELTQESPSDGKWRSTKKHRFSFQRKQERGDPKLLSVGTEKLFAAFPHTAQHDREELNNLLWYTHTTVVPSLLREETAALCCWHLGCEELGNQHFQTAISYCKNEQEAKHIIARVNSAQLTGKWHGLAQVARQVLDNPKALGEAQLEAAWKLRLPEEVVLLYIQIAVRMQADCMMFEALNYPPSTQKDVKALGKATAIFGYKPQRRAT